MTVNVHSVWAYHDIVASGYLSNKRALVLRVFTENYPQKYTATHIVKLLGGRYVSETIRNRVTELMQMGFLDEVGTVECEYTHQHVTLYQWSGRKVPFVKRIEEVVCKRCGGVGRHKKVVWHDLSKEI